jgi:hypothetical protein
MHVTQHHKRTISLAMSVSCCLAGMLALAAPATAGEMTHGEMSAAIRSADHPCAHVLALESSGDNAWTVDCNSGTFLVTRNEDGSYAVTQTKESQ